jgi:hypothetical protein
MDNMDIDVKEAGCEGMDGIHLPQDRAHWWSVMNMVNEP